MSYYAVALLSRHNAGAHLRRHHRYYYHYQYPPAIFCSGGDDVLLARTLTAASESSSSSSTPSQSPQQPQQQQQQQQPQRQRRRPLPIAAFIDLDNVAPKSFRREDAAAFLDPLVEFGRRANNNLNHRSVLGTTENDNDNEDTAVNTADDDNLNNQIQIRAFGNLSTRSYRGPIEKQHARTSQAYIPWDGKIAQTGYDEKGVLRCGVCDKKFHLTTNDKRRMRSTDCRTEEEVLYRKLKRHMKLHDDEHRRRQIKIRERGDVTKIRKKNKYKINQRMVRYEGTNREFVLPHLEENEEDKDVTRSKKYVAAQVGLRNLKHVGMSRKGKVRLTRRNDLFQILREENVIVVPSDDVDAKLIHSANRWMGHVENDKKKRMNRQWRMNVKGQKIMEEEEERSNANNEHQPEGILMVYSKDSDFLTLLQDAKRRGFLAVSVTDEVKTTAGTLLSACDVALGPFGKWLHKTDDDDVESMALSSCEDDVDDDDVTRDDNFCSEKGIEEDDGDEYSVSDVESTTPSSNDSTHEDDFNEETHEEDEDDEHIFSDVESTYPSSSDDDTHEDDFRRDDDTEEEEDDGEDYSIKEVSSLGASPISWLSSVNKSLPENSDSAMMALSVSEEGYKFMMSLEQKRRESTKSEEENGDGEDDEDDGVYVNDSEIVWHLSDGVVATADQPSQAGTTPCIPIMDEADVRTTLPEIRSTKKITTKPTELMAQHGIFAKKFKASNKKSHDDNDDDNIKTELRNGDNDIVNERAQEKDQKTTNTLVSIKATTLPFHTKQLEPLEATREAASKVTAHISKVPNLPKNKKQRRRKLKALQKYQCTGCGEVIDTWDLFLMHMRQCEYCRRAGVRRIGRENHRSRYVVYAMNHDESGDENEENDVNSLKVEQEEEVWLDEIQYSEV